MSDIIVKTEIQEKHNFEPLATIKRGYVCDGDRVYWIELKPVYGERVTLCLGREEVEAILDAFDSENMGDCDPDSAWPDGRG